jgi:hypothetical protein
VGGGGPVGLVGATRVAGGPAAAGCTAACVRPALTATRGRCSPSTSDTGGLLQPVTAAHGRCSPPSGNSGRRLLSAVDQWLLGMGDGGLLRGQWRACGQAGGQRQCGREAMTAVVVCGAGARVVLLCQVRSLGAA